MLVKSNQHLSTTVSTKHDDQLGHNAEKNKAVSAALGQDSKLSNVDL